MVKESDEKKPVFIFGEAMSDATIDIYGDVDLSNLPLRKSNIEKFLAEFPSAVSNLDIVVNVFEGLSSMSIVIQKKKDDGRWATVNFNSNYPKFYKVNRNIGTLKQLKVKTNEEFFEYLQKKFS